MRLGDVIPEAYDLMMQRVKFPNHNCDGKLVRSESDTVTCEKCGRTFYAPQDKGLVSKDGFPIHYTYRRRKELR